MAHSLPSSSLKSIFIQEKDTSDGYEEKCPALIKREDLVGSSPFFKHEIFEEKEAEATDIPALNAENGTAQNQNQLAKKQLCVEKELEILRQFAEESPWCAWISESLAHDLNVPVTCPSHFQDFLQIFFIGKNFTPFVLSLFSAGDDRTKVETYTKDFARLLIWSLLDFCHLDFTVLPCCLKRTDFSHEQLAKIVKKQKSVITRYFKSRTSLSGKSFLQLKSATTALVGATFVPCLLQNPDVEQMWIFLMNKEWRKEVSLQIELLHGNDSLELIISSNLQVKELVATLEAAKRLSFTDEIEVSIQNQRVQLCLRMLKIYFKDRFKIQLKLYSGRQHDKSPFFVERLKEREVDQDKETSSAVSNQAEERQVLMQSMYEMIVDGELSELCQHPSLQSPGFMQDFDDFVRGHNYMQQVVSAVDREHGLPLLYWSAWSFSPHLTHWCLAVMDSHVETGPRLSGGLLRAVMATILFANLDSNSRSVIKSFLTRFRLLDDKLASTDILKLSLPLPSKFPTQIMVNFREHGLCYLDDPSLPIPATLLSVTVTEDAVSVSVELTSQHWYLALRLLADREVDETGGDDSTLLHIAADKGNLEAITLAVKSGASLERENSKCMTPLHYACSRGLKAPIEHLLDLGADVNIQNVFGNTPLHMACVQGRKDSVELLLLHGADVNVKGKDGVTPLGKAYVEDYSDIIQLLLRYGVDDSLLHKACSDGDHEKVKQLLQNWADVSNRNSLRRTPLHSACIEGHKSIVELLFQHGADVNAQDQYGTTPLHNACSRGKKDNTDTVDLLLLHKADVNARDKDGNTPLHKACTKGHKDTVELLLRQEADVKAQNMWKKTPLQNAFSANHDDVVALLIRHGANANGAEDRHGNTPLNRACSKGSRDMVELLLRHKADVNVHDGYGNTPLHKACSTGRHDIVELLLSHKADVNEVVGYGNTPLHTACSRGSTEMVELLLSHEADVNVQDGYGNTPLHKACSTGRHDIVELLLSHKADVNVLDGYGNTPLHKACSTGKHDIVELLLSHEADMNVLDGYGNTPLHKACSTGKHDIVELLLSHKVDVNVQDKKGNTPLHTACSTGSKDIVELLLSHKADVNVQEKYYGDTPLLIACSTGSTEMVELLLSHKADVNVQDRYGNTPLLIACSTSRKEMVELLLSHKADVNVHDGYGNTPLHTACSTGSKEMVELLLSHKADVNVHDGYGNTPLHTACSTGSKEMVELLLSHEADMNVLDGYGNTPLHKACSEGQKDTSELSLLHRTQPKWYGRDKPLDQTSSGYYRDTIELLLSHGADVNAQDEYGYTPLHRTSSRGQREMVKLLLRHKADVNVQGKDGNTPTITARRIGHDDIHKLLMHPEAAGTEQDKDDTTQSYECNRVKGQKRAFEQLLHHDADVLVHDQDGKALSN